MNKIRDKQLVMMGVGLPGSGKSHLFHGELERYIGFKLLNSVDNVYNNAGIYEGNNFSKAYLELKPVLADYLKANISLNTYSGRNITIDCCNVSKKSRKYKLDAIMRRKDYHVVAIVFDKDLETIKKSLDRRNKDYGKEDRYVTDELFNTYVNMYSPPAEEEGFDAIISHNKFLTEYFPKDPIIEQEERQPRAGRNTNARQWDAIPAPRPTTRNPTARPATARPVRPIVNELEADENPFYAGGNTFTIHPRPQADMATLEAGAAAELARLADTQNQAQQAIPAPLTPTVAMAGRTWWDAFNEITRERDIR